MLTILNPFFIQFRHAFHLLKLTSVAPIISPPNSSTSKPKYRRFSRGQNAPPRTYSSSSSFLRYSYCTAWGSWYPVTDHRWLPILGEYQTSRIVTFTWSRYNAYLRLQYQQPSNLQPSNLRTSHLIACYRKPKFIVCDIYHGIFLRDPIQGLKKKTVYKDDQAECTTVMTLVEHEFK